MTGITASYRAALGGPVRRALAASVALLLVGQWVAPGMARAGSPSVPQDPAAHGYVGLCDEHGNNVSGGSIDSAPFVWKAVASTPPPAAYRGQGENAVLNIYQLRPDTAPEDWSGDSLTGASFYSSRAHPAAQATYADTSLSAFMQEFPPQEDGLYQLRMYYGKVNYGLYNATYPATVIRVDGNAWSVVQGGTVDCGAARGVSNEALTQAVPKADTVARKKLPAGEKVVADRAPGTAISAAPPRPRSHTGKGKRAAAGTTPAAGSDPRGPNARPAAKIASLPQQHSSSHVLLWVAVQVAAVVLAVAAFAAVRLRRRRAAAE